MGRRSRDDFSGAIFRCAALLILLFAGVPVVALDGAGTVHSDDEKKYWVLDDPSSTLTIDDILSGTPGAKFTPVDRVPSFGFTNSSIWVKLRFPCGPGGTAKILEVLYPGLDLVEAYIPTPTGYVMKRSGETVPFGEREIKHRNHVFRVPRMTGKTQDVYLRLKSESSLSFRINLYDEYEFFHNDRTAQFVWGLFFGVLIIMILYNLFLFFSLGDGAYGFYVLFLVSQFLFSFTINGFSVRYLWPDSPAWAGKSHPFFSALLILCALIFSFFFLRIRKHSKVITVTYYFLFALLALQALSVPYLPYRTVVTVNMYLGYVFILFMLFTGVYMVRRGFGPAWYYLSAWVFFLLGTVAYTVGYTLSSVSGVRSRTVFTENAVEIGTVLMVLFLALALGDRINVLRREKNELMKTKELDDLKSEFFASISHEIRTPLTLMLTPVRSLLDGSYRARPDRAFFEMLERNGSRLLALINNLLDFSRLDAGKTVINAVYADLHVMLSDQVALARSACDSKKVTMGLEPENASRMLCLDREKIETVIANLLINAINHTDRGGAIRIRTREDEERVYVEFEDNGRGIPPGAVPFVFDRFSRAETSPGDGAAGTGIGLALAREYLALHGGSISVESRHAAEHPANHGTLFTVSLPRGDGHLKNKNNVVFHDAPIHKPAHDPRAYALVSGENRLQPPGHSGEEPAGGKPLILIVEDTPDMHRLLREILEPSFSLICFDGAAGALDFLGSADVLPDLILSDMMMPRMDGLAFTRALRSEPRFEGIPILLLTANSETDIKIEGLRAGAADFMVKPFNARELTARINAQLEMKHLRDRLLRSNELLYEALKEENRPLPAAPGPAAEEKINKVRAFIDTHFTAGLTREKLAEAVGMSPDYLSRLFNKIIGQRIDEYINALRLREAARMLRETDRTVITVAMETGFESLRHFNRLFSGAFAMTPSEYRGRHKKNRTITV